MINMFLYIHTHLIWNLDNSGAKDDVKLFHANFKDNYLIVKESKIF